MSRLITPYDKSVLYAFRALFEGKANDGQQKRAMEWLLFNACHIGADCFGSDDRETAFQLGERWVGLQIAKMRDPDALALVEKKARRKTEATEAIK